MTIPADDKEEFERMFNEMACVVGELDGLRLREFAVKIYELGYERGQEMAQDYYDK